MDLRKDYFEDFRLFENRLQAFWSLLFAATLILLPLFAKPYFLTIVSLMAIHVMVALGLNILVGNTGQLSLGHAGFVAIGAYTLVLLMKLGVPFPGALLAGAFLAALFGALLGIPSLRLEGPYLAIATLGFGLAVTVIIGRTEVLGGRMGLSVPRVGLGWTGLKYDTAMYYLIIGSAGILTLLARSLVSSYIGRAFQAIRDSDIAASAAGVDVARYKTLSFAISAFFGGIAGGFWALFLTFINPSLFTFVLSVNFLAIIIVGGLGSVTGSLLGAVVLTFLSLQLQNVVNMPLIGPLLTAFSERFMSVSGLPNVAGVMTGLILILIVLFEPLGLYGIWLRIKRYWKTWPF